MSHMNVYVVERAFSFVLTIFYVLFLCICVHFYLFSNQFSKQMYYSKTLGKLHFDPFENLLTMIAGEKHVHLFPPDRNEQLYEGHIVEGRLEYSAATGTFSRRQLLQSTAMVMSPIDIRKPNLERFPAFSDAVGMTCVIREGDALFLPAFWWHEVQSRPDDHARNIAVNWWFAPVWDKEFPCQECRPALSRTYDEYIECEGRACFNSDEELYFK